MASDIISGKKLLAIGLAGSVGALVLLFATMTLRSGGPLALATLPTPTPTNTPVPAGVIDFSARVLTDSNNAGTCDSSGSPTNTCRVAQGTTFLVGVYLNQLPNALPGGNYAGYDVILSYSGVTSAENAQSLDLHQWPSCALDAGAFQPGMIFAGCAIGIGSPESAYTGRMMTAELTCEQSGVITLLHGESATSISDGFTSGRYHEDEGTTETLNIDCAPAVPYPGDTDGDGCPDAKELGMNAMMGGARNFLNANDYFNPTHDGENRIDDILTVLYKYFIDSGNPAYTAGTDRTLIGPNAWNLGPPDGLQRIDDILASVKHYFHDCS